MGESKIQMSAFQCLNIDYATFRTGSARIFIVRLDRHHKKAPSC